MAMHMGHVAFRVRDLQASAEFAKRQRPDWGPVDRPINPWGPLPAPSLFEIGIPILVDPTHVDPAQSAITKGASD